jgi:excisionase family DNA binding protein
MAEANEIENTGLECMDILNVKETARYLRCSQSKVYDMVKRNVIPYAKIEGRIVFVRTDILKWIKTLRAGITIDDETKLQEVV